MENMQDILKNYYAKGGKELFEAPIGSYGSVGSDDNKFDKASADAIPMNPAQKINMGINVLGALTLAATAGKSTWEFFDPSSIEGMIGTGAATVFSSLAAFGVSATLLPDVTGFRAKHDARKNMSKDLAIQISKEKPELLKDIANFKKSFLNNTPSAILKHSLELGNILVASGEMQDYSGGKRFDANPSDEDIVFGSTSDTHKRTTLVIKMISEYVGKYDDLFDNIAEKHGMTPNDLTAFVYYANGEADLAEDWFNNIYAKATA